MMTVQRRGGVEPSPEQRLVAMLLARRWRFATAESVTGGLVGALVTTVPGSGDAYAGGVIAYTDETKARMLGVDRELLEKEGAVCAEAARQMARGVREHIGADIAVSTTGFAGPNAPDGMPVGLVYVGVATARGARVREHRLEGSREGIRRQASEAAVALALDTLDEETSSARPPT